MSTSAKKLFIDFLQNRNACKPGLAWARKQRTGRDILAKLERRDWLVWLVHAVGGPAWAEYLRVKGPALAEYLRVADPTWAEYERVEGLAAKKALTWKRVLKAIQKKRN